MEAKHGFDLDHPALWARDAPFRLCGQDKFKGNQSRTLLELKDWLNTTGGFKQEMSQMSPALPPFAVLVPLVHIQPLAAHCSQLLNRSVSQQVGPSPDRNRLPAILEQVDEAPLETGPGLSNQLC